MREKVGLTIGVAAVFLLGALLVGLHENHPWIFWGLVAAVAWWMLQTDLASGREMQAKMEQDRLSRRREQGLDDDDD